MVGIECTGRMGVRPRDFVFVCLGGSGSLTGSAHAEICGARNHILEVRLESWRTCDAG